MPKLTAAQQRFFDNAIFLAANQLIFERLSNASFPLCALKDVCRDVTDGTHDTPKYLDAGIPFLTGKNIDPSGLDFENARYISEDDHKRFSQHCLVEKGDVLITLVGTIDKVAIVDTDREFSIKNVGLLKPDFKGLDSRYLFYFLRSKYFQEQAITYSKKTAQAFVGLKKLRIIEIPVPSLALQREISRFLDILTTGSTNLLGRTLPKLPEPLADVGRIVGRIEELVAKVEEARGLRSQTLAEIDVLSNNALAAIFNSLSEEFGCQLLENLIIEANYGTSTKCHYERLNDSVPVLRIPNVASELINFEDMKYGSPGDKELGNICLEEGDILVVRTNGSADLVGRCAVVPTLTEPTAFASYLIKLRCNQDQIKPAYLQLMLKYLRTSGQLFDLARTTAGQYNVSLGRLKLSRVPVPSVDKQEDVIAYLDALQSKINSLKKFQIQTARELDALLPSILDKAFKGEL